MPGASRYTTAAGWYHLKEMRFTVVLAPEPGGGYSVTCPALPGCVSQGESQRDALDNIREAMKLCLEVRKDEGLPPPVETADLVASEIRNCLKERAQEELPLTIETHVVEVEAGIAA